ncbi:universal stress protein [Algihabitans albus]|uniref:universal stress protein n=1 Tax=Algihabitans albus TaxID=2164067 RepID=UPI000E5C8CD6|nr:universal stress protein [Algihabitans albus]
MYRDILLAVDLGHPDTQDKAVSTALEYTKAFGSRLHVITVVPDFGMSIVGSFFPANYEQQALEQARDALHAFTAKHVPADLKVQHIVGHGTIYQEILRCAEAVEADLIVMASHRPGLEDYLLGPNAARVMRHASTSVLVVRD